MQTLSRIYALSRRNVILRYKNSIAGFLWGFLKPLLYLLIFIVIFSKQFVSIGNYVLYATSGLIFWFFFANVTAQSVNNIVSSAGLLKSINLEPILFPLSEMVSELFNFALTLLVFMVLMYGFGLHYGLHLLLIIPVVVLFAVFSLGVTLVLSSVNVFLRDVGIMWNTILPALFYLTPLAYPEDLIPEKFRFVLQFNPIYYFIRLGRSILVQGEMPAWALWGQCAAIAAATFIVGRAVFNKFRYQFISAI